MVSPISFSSDGHHNNFKSQHNSFKSDDMHHFQSAPANRNFASTTHNFDSKSDNIRPTKTAFQSAQQRFGSCPSC